MKSRAAGLIRLPVGLPMAAAIIATAAIPPAVPGADSPAAGIGGVHRTGFWTAVWLEESATQSADRRAWVEDADDQLVGSPPGLRPAGDGGGPIRWSVRPGRPAARLAIGRGAGEGGPPAGEHNPSGRPLAVQAPDTGDPFPGEASPSTRPLLLLHGDVPAAAAAARLVAGERPAMEVVQLAAGPVPPGIVPRDLDAFDAAIFCGRELTQFDNGVLAAVDGWVRCGGQLVLVAGRSSAAIAAADGVAAEWLPARQFELVPVRRLGGLEAYARSGGLSSRMPRQGLDAPRFTAPIAGVVEATAGDGDNLPLVVRRGHGLGTITWLGLDLDEPWATAWPGCDRLLGILLGGRSDADGSLAATETGRRRPPDLAGQFRVALDGFPARAGRSASTSVPFEVIAGLGVLYLLALYPVDWWLVSRSGRPGLSWLTLPLLAAGFTAAAWALGGLWGRDAPARCRMAEVLDIDAASRLVRGSSWLAIRSPDNGRLDVAVSAASSVAREADAAVSWFADSGRGFGGVDALVAHPSLAAGPYAYGDSLATLAGAPIAAASSRLFEAEWVGTAAMSPATSSLTRDARGLLRGSITHHLPFALVGCRLLHGGWLYDVGDLAPGQTFDTESGRGPRSLAADLTRRVAVGDRDRTQRWDPADTDAGRILEVAGLHQAAGGVAYTGLELGRFARLDLSPLLAVDRGILVGLAVDGSRGTDWSVMLRSEAGDQAGEGAGLPIEAAAASLVRIVIPLAAAPTPEAP
jgi:hypothetical protein